MVYQQFINYPSMTVADNIASPLKLRKEKMDNSGIAARVNELAAKLHIEAFLARLPAELSGGQQQRVALARALAKNAPLMLLDEPLVNLDYKLREELRDELSLLFAAGDSTVVYATTEPAEALLLGGYTAVMDAGRLLQYGPTAEVFQPPEVGGRGARLQRPADEPGRGQRHGHRRGVADRRAVAADLAAWQQRQHAARPPRHSASAPARCACTAGDGDLALAGTVELAEISGSDTFVHVDTPIGELVAQLTGVHDFTLGAAVTLYLSPAQVYLFDAAGDLPAGPGPQGELTWPESTSTSPTPTARTRSAMKTTRCCR